MPNESTPDRKPGVCIPWQDKLKELPPVVSNPELVKEAWEDIDSLGYTYIWQCLLSIGPGFRLR